MFSNLGPLEITIIVAILLLLFGGKKIPELAQGLGKGINIFKKALKDEPEEKKDTPQLNESDKPKA